MPSLCRKITPSLGNSHAGSPGLAADGEVGPVHDLQHVWVIAELGEGLVLGQSRDSSAGGAEECAGAGGTEQVELAVQAGARHQDLSGAGGVVGDHVGASVGCQERNLNTIDRHVGIAVGAGLVIGETNLDVSLDGGEVWGWGCDGSGGEEGQD
jgi:hypothetical protein